MNKQEISSEELALLMQEAEKSFHAGTVSNAFNNFFLGAIFGYKRARFKSPLEEERDLAERMYVLALDKLNAKEQEAIVYREAIVSALVLLESMFEAGFHANLQRDIRRELKEAINKYPPIPPSPEVQQPVPLSQHPAITHLEQEKKKALLIAAFKWATDNHLNCTGGLWSTYSNAVVIRYGSILKIVDAYIAYEEKNIHNSTNEQ